MTSNNNSNAVKRFHLLLKALNTPNENKSLTKCKRDNKGNFTLKSYTNT